jgi:hypothetical protein
MKTLGRMMEAKCGEVMVDVLVEEFEAAICGTIEKLLVPAAELEALKYKEYLTEKEVGLLCSVSPDALIKGRSQGQGPGYIKDGRKVLYPRRELAAYFERRLVKTRG